MSTLQQNRIFDFLEVFTLCGSTKFKKEFEAVNLALTLRGKVVITVSSFGHADKIDWTKEQKEILDAVHKRKIDHSEAIVVIDVGGYVGSSTKSEIKHAEELGLPVYYLSDFPELLNSDQNPERCDTTPDATSTTADNQNNKLK